MSDSSSPATPGAPHGAAPGSGPSSGPSAAMAGDTAPPTRFGRGWIPASRDIGLPSDDWPASACPDHFDRDCGAGAASLLSASSFGQARGCVQGERDGQGDGMPTPAPSAKREGDGVPHNGWSDARKVAFLHHLADRGDVRAACAQVGMSRTSAYLLRRRDAVFAQGWSAALLLARTHAEEVLATRAIDGVDEAVWFRGELVGRRRRYDSRLLLAHLARLDRLAEQHHVSEQAGRFDEVLALLSGEAPDADFFQPPLDPALDPAFDPMLDEAAPDRVLPLSRRDYVDCAPADPEGAGQDWDAWQARACDHVDAVLRQARQEREADVREGQGVVAWDGWIGPGLDDLPAEFASPDAGGQDCGGDADDAPPMEYKSLDGPAPYLSGQCKPCKPAGPCGVFRKIRRRRERIAGADVIASEGRRGDAPTPLPPPRWPTFRGEGSAESAQAFHRDAGQGRLGRDARSGAGPAQAEPVEAPR